MNRKRSKRKDHERQPATAIEPVASRWARKTSERLRAQIGEQMQFLRSSNRLYDEGAVVEAKRLAVTIRVLVHNGSGSQGLLQLTGDLSRWKFLSSGGPVDPENLLTTSSLTILETSSAGARHLPPLDDLPPGALQQVPFERWWNMEIVKDDQGEIFTRRDLVLALANKEGGAHVDKKSEVRMDRLASAQSLGWMFTNAEGDERYVEGDPLLGSVRQIAWELETTIAGYTGT